MTDHEPQWVEQQVLEFFGCAAKAERWLYSPKHTFGRLTPREVIESGRGAEVVQLIRQAEHGFVF
ncbi:MAG: antitoxin Xre/MbcA/ParS toxin-binding domain-containing protein [Pseudomonadaceae bacterium]